MLTEYPPSTVVAAAHFALSSDAEPVSPGQMLHVSSAIFHNRCGRVGGTRSLSSDANSASMLLAALQPNGKCVSMILRPKWRSLSTGPLANGTGDQSRLGRRVLLAAALAAPLVAQARDLARQTGPGNRAGAGRRADRHRRPRSRRGDAEGAGPTLAGQFEARRQHRHWRADIPRRTGRWLHVLSRGDEPRRPALRDEGAVRRRGRLQAHRDDRQQPVADLRSGQFAGRQHRRLRGLRQGKPGKLNVPQLR